MCSDNDRNIVENIIITKVGIAFEHRFFYIFLHSKLEKPYKTEMILFIGDGTIII